MPRLVPSLLLGVLGLLQVPKNQVTGANYVIGCILANLYDPPAFKLPCTHIVYGSYNVGHSSTTLQFNIKDGDLTNMMKIRRENPNAKFLPYFSSFDIECPTKNKVGTFFSDFEFRVGRLDEKFKDYVYSDGIAFDMDALPACDGIASQYAKCEDKSGSLIACGAREWANKLFDALLPTRGIWHEGPTKECILHTSHDVTGLGKVFFDRLVKIDLVDLPFEPGKIMPGIMKYVSPFQIIMKSSIKAGSSRKAEILAKESDDYVRMATGTSQFLRGISLNLTDENTPPPICDKPRAPTPSKPDKRDDNIPGLPPGCLEDPYDKPRVPTPPKPDRREDSLPGPPPGFPAFPGIPYDTEHNKESTHLLKDAVVYCKWKDTVVESSRNTPPVSGCSFVGFEPSSAQDKAILQGFKNLRSSNPQLKLLLSLKLNYFLRDSYQVTEIQNFLKLYNMVGVDMIVDEHVRESDLNKATSIVEEIKKQSLVEILIITINSASYSIYEYQSLKTIAELASYINIAHFYGYDMDALSEIFTAAPLTSTYDDKNIVFSISHAIRLGVPPNKILVGVPNFGYMYSEHNKASLKEITFKEVCGIMKTLTHSMEWDEFSATPYISSFDLVVTYENSTSIGKKFDLVARRGMAGVSVYWIDSPECDEISSDGKTISKQIQEIVDRQTCSGMPSRPSRPSSYPDGLLDDLMG